MKKTLIILFLLASCSSAGPLTREQSFTDNGDGSVTNNITHLLWQKEVDNTQRRWKEADQYCEDLTLAGKDNWHLPTARELKNLAIPGKEKPSINTTFFPGTPSAPFWTRSPADAGVPTPSADYGVAVNFHFGDLESPLYKSKPCYVRCICRPSK